MSKRSQAKAAKAAEPAPIGPVTPDIRNQPVDLAGKPIDTTPADLKEFKGSYKYKFSADKDERFGLKVIEDDPRGETHHLKSVNHYWSGTEQQFKEQFD